MEAALQFGEISPYAQRAERAIKVFTDLVGNAKLEVPIPRHEDLLKVASKERNLRVGIIGAGAAGLFTAMIFDYLKKTYGLEVDYEILEARGEDRLGGRLYSHKFGGSPTLPEPGKHDYFDVGAMRFPDHAIMERYVTLAYRHMRCVV